MIFSNPNSKPIAERRVIPPPARWQALQTQLSRSATPDVSPWTRRSRVISRWRVGTDASVSVWTA